VVTLHTTYTVPEPSLRRKLYGVKKLFYPVYMNVLTIEFINYLYL